jgi:peptidoglycan/xylan/chitin deacetylase (PgdA/CDA1 family)
MKKIPVLMYHDICHEYDIISKNKYMTVSASKFQKDIEFIKNKYTTIFVSDLWNYVNNGIELPDNCLMITFDDGYSGFYEYAYPIIEKISLKATVSIITNSIDNQYKEQMPKLTWDQIKRMYESGYVDFQSHTHNMHHKTPRLGCLKKDNESIEEYTKVLKQDYLQSKQNIEDHINNNVISYFYPFGIYSQLANEVLDSIGCKITFIANNSEHKKPNQVSYQNLSSLFFIDRMIVYDQIDLSKIEYLHS